MKSTIRAAIGCAAAGLVLAATHAAQADTTIPGNACSVGYADRVNWNGGTSQTQWQSSSTYVKTVVAATCYTFYCPVVRTYATGGLDHIYFNVYNADGSTPVSCTIQTYSSFGTYYGGISNSVSGTSGNSTITISTTNSSLFPEQPGGTYVARCDLYTNDRLYGIQYLETSTP